MKSDLFQGRYLFHFHTTLTDGRLELEDYFSFAKKHEINQLITLEHIRKTPGYDPESFASDLKKHSEKWGIDSFLGFEAKIMPDATINIDEELLEKCDVIGIAEHAFPDDAALYRDVLEKIFCSYPKKFPHIQFVWVHPGLWGQKKKMIDLDNHFKFFQLAIENNILVENNLRYHLPSQSVLDKLPDGSKVIGADAHSAQDLEKFVHTLGLHP